MSAAARRRPPSAAALAVAAALTTWIDDARPGAASASSRAATSGPLAARRGPVALHRSAAASPGAAARRWSCVAGQAVVAWAFVGLIAERLAACRIGASLGRARRRHRAPRRRPPRPTRRRSRPRADSIHPLLLAGGVGLPAAGRRRSPAPGAGSPLAGLVLLAVYSVPVSVLDGGGARGGSSPAHAGRLPGDALPARGRAGRPAGAARSASPSRPPTPRRSACAPERPDAARWAIGGRGHRPRGGAAGLHPDPGPRPARRRLGPGRRRGHHREPDGRPAPRPAARRGRATAAAHHRRPRPRRTSAIAALTVFTNNEWQRRAPGRSRPTSRPRAGRCHRCPGSSGLGRPRGVRLRGVTATADFDSRWLPDAVPGLRRSRPPGDWRYDRETMDFFAARRRRSTPRGSTYSMTGGPAST